MGERAWRSFPPTAQRRLARQEKERVCTATPSPAAAGSGAPYYAACGHTGTACNNPRRLAYAKTSSPLIHPCLALVGGAIQYPQEGAGGGGPCCRWYSPVHPLRALCTPNSRLLLCPPSSFLCLGPFASVSPPRDLPIALLCSALLIPHWLALRLPSVLRCHDPSGVASSHPFFLCACPFSPGWPLPFCSCWSACLSFPHTALACVAHCLLSLAMASQVCLRLLPFLSFPSGRHGTGWLFPLSLLLSRRRAWSSCLLLLHRARRLAFCTPPLLLTYSSLGHTRTPLW